ncbi:MAG TPA: riboflavin biosynthesis protein RibF [Opitutaceae bacterium]
MSPPLTFASVESADLDGRPLHLAIGMFDGVHLGHQSVIEAAVHAAAADEGRAAVLTFRPHPSRLFRPDQPTRLMFDDREQAARLGRLGIDAVITHPFTREFASIPADGFLPWLRSRRPTLAAVYVGENWRFGAGRKGDVALLVAAGRGAGISVVSAPPVNFDGEPVTSTRIRALLERGEVAAANALLGSPYASAGAVQDGRRLGRTIGFPTLNVAWDPELRPRFGVYQVRVGEKRLPGIANYGTRPTVANDGPPVFEVHLLTECPFGPGDFLRAEWTRFLRAERKFESLDELKAQIAKDIVLVSGSGPA